MEWEVGAKFLQILAVILTVTEGIKRILSIKWILKLLGWTEIGGGISIALAILTGLAVGLKTYSADGVLTAQEVWLVISEILASMGVYKMTIAGRYNGNAEKS